jgi:hypothetical protein
MRKSTVLLSVALVASVASAAWLWQSLSAERVRSAELETQLARQSIELERHDEGAANALKEAVTVPASRSEPAAGQALAETSPAKVAAGDEQEDWLAYQRQLMRDPKYREARREQERLKYMPRRANLIRLLGFTPEQADVTIETDIDMDLTVQEKGLNQVTKQSAKERREQLDVMERERQDKLRSLLGEEKRVRLQTYMESRESRMQVEDLRSDLTAATALRDDQIEPLITALHAERAQMQSELRAFRDTLDWETDNRDTWQRYVERQTQLLMSMNDRMMSSASSLLTEAQLDALDTQLKLNFAEHVARQRLNRIQTSLDKANRPGSASN